VTRPALTTTLDVYPAHKLQGLESAVERINLLFSRGNTGKLMVVL